MYVSSVTTNLHISSVYQQLVNFVTLLQLLHFISYHQIVHFIIYYQLEHCINYHHLVHFISYKQLIHFISLLQFLHFISYHQLEHFISYNQFIHFMSLSPPCTFSSNQWNTSLSLFQQFPDFQCPPLPGKTIVKNMNKDFLEKRKKSLNTYLMVIFCLIYHYQFFSKLFIFIQFYMWMNTYVSFSTVESLKFVGGIIFMDCRLFSKVL